MNQDIVISRNCQAQGHAFLYSLATRVEALQIPRSFERPSLVDSYIGAMLLTSSQVSLAISSTIGTSLNCPADYTFTKNAVPQYSSSLPYCSCAVMSSNKIQ